MKVGLIMTVACNHSMQQEAWEAARRNSHPDTPFIVLFNGIAPMAVCEGIETIHREQPFTDEADLWWWGVELAVQRGWDWVMFIHDDFRIDAPGWEADLALSDGWCIALASWLAYEEWDVEANTRLPASSHLAVAIDSMAMGINVALFRSRGCVTETRFQFGFGAWDAQAWALERGYAIWRIQLPSDHNWRNDNSRAVMRKGAEGHPWFKTNWSVVLPSCVVDAHHISVKGKITRIAPPEASNA